MDKFFRDFHDVEAGPDFRRAQSMIATPFQYLDIALDTATSNAIYNVSGDFLYLDAITTGTVTIELNNQYTDAAAPFQCSAGFGINALFKQLKISWQAQPGKKVRLMYSTGDRIVPTNSTSISGTVSIAANGNAYASAYKSITTMGANTPDTVFAAGSNTNGAIIWNASFMSANASGVPTMGFVAKATAPATVVDGDLVLAPCVSPPSASYPFGANLTSPIKIAAGKGLYFISTNAEVSPQCIRSVLYSLL